MGCYTITVKGQGCHHNGERANEVSDADLRARQLVETLKLQGHEIHEATFQLDNYDHTPVEGSPAESLLDPAPQPATE